VHWSPAQAIFSSVDLSLSDWGLAGLVAASVLLVEEARKPLLRLWNQQTKPRAPSSLT